MLMAFFITHFFVISITYPTNRRNSADFQKPGTRHRKLMGFRLLLE